MTRIRFGLVVLISAGMAALSGAQDYRAYSNDQLRAVLASPSGAFADIKAMNALSMRLDPAAVPLILAHANSPYLNVRLNALASLARYRDPQFLPFFQNIILDYQAQYTVSERIVAIKAYVNTPGYNPSVLQTALALATAPEEIYFLRWAISGQ